MEDTISTKWNRPRLAEGIRAITAKSRSTMLMLLRTRFTWSTVTVRTSDAAGEKAVRVVSNLHDLRGWARDLVARLANPAAGQWVADRHAQVPVQVRTGAP